MPSYFRHIVHFLLVAMMMGGCKKAYPKSFPERKDLKNAKGRLGGIQDIGKKIDVNAFDIELFYNKNTLACELQKYSKIEVTLLFLLKGMQKLHW